MFFENLSPMHAVRIYLELLASSCVFIPPSFPPILLCHVSRQAKTTFVCVCFTLVCIVNLPGEQVKQWPRFISMQRLRFPRQLQRPSSTGWWLCSTDTTLHPRVRVCVWYFFFFIRLRQSRIQQTQSLSTRTQQSRP